MFQFKTFAAETNVIGGMEVKSGTTLAKQLVFIMQPGKSICTGTLIGCDIVLTAAHCVENSEQSGVVVRFSVKPTKSDAPMKVTSMKIHPMWRKGNGYDQSIGDLAILKLEGAAPTTQMFSTLDGDFVNWASAERFVLAGYGVTKQFNTPDPGAPLALRTIELPPLKGAAIEKAKEPYRVLCEKKDECRPKMETLNKALDKYFTDGPENPFIFVDQTSQRGTCSGDSGGPLFADINGKMKQVGVAATVTFGLDGKPTCFIFSKYVNLAFYQSWINETIMGMYSPVEQQKQGDVQQKPGVCQFRDPFAG